MEDKKIIQKKDVSWDELRRFKFKRTNTGHTWITLEILSDPEDNDLSDFRTEEEDEDSE